MASNDFRVTGARSGVVIVTCKACGESFDGKYSETLAWRQWHRASCTGKPAQTG